MKLLHSALFVALVLSPVLLHAERGMQDRRGGPYQAEAREDFRNDNAGAYGAGYFDEGFNPGAAETPTFRQTPQYQEETLQNAGDPMQEEELQNINNMSNEPDIG